MFMMNLPEATPPPDKRTEAINALTDLLVGMTGRLPAPGHVGLAIDALDALRREIPLVVVKPAKLIKEGK